MSLSSLRARIRDAKYRVMSDPAAWNGAPATVRDVTRDKLVGFGGSEAVLQTVFLSVRMTEVPCAAEGDIVIIAASGDTYKIIAEPMADNSAGEWICEAERVE